MGCRLLDAARRGAEPTGPRAVAQLAHRVVAPAVRRAARGRTASVIRPCAYRRERQAIGDRRGDESISGGAVAQLAGEVDVPAVRRAAPGHAAGVRRTCTPAA